MTMDEETKMHIEHVAIWTSDLDRLRSFYVNYFGAKAGPRYVNVAKRFESLFLRFESGPRLEIMHRSGGQAGVLAGDIEHAGIAHIALALGSREHVDEMTARLAAAGCPIVDGPRVTGDGYYESVVLDPEGNRIELTI
jgi:lactoylglutathione lyase